jgi:hypothetical protein
MSAKQKVNIPESLLTGKPGISDDRDRSSIPVIALEHCQRSVLSNNAHPREFDYLEELSLDHKGDDKNNELLKLRPQNRQYVAGFWMLDTR